VVTMVVIEPIILGDINMLTGVVGVQIWGLGVITWELVEQLS
jgi:hypothetical protein